ncbi:MAG: class II fructose-bisphosphate aldolase, partial [bacterium]|nr:class II fructose-bisphosphate aldolase [bacterium]
MEVTLRDILTKAYIEHKSILQFNINSLEDIVGVIEAGYELNVPVIVACTPKVLSLLRGRSIVGVYRSLADYCDTPVVLHLDRAIDLRDAWRAISIGFTSVMVDGSNLSYEENVSLTSTVVEFARAAGISVEGKIVSRIENTYEVTVPDLAASFIADTGIDVLEIAIKSYSDIESLERIKKAIKIPLSIRKNPNISIEELKRLKFLGVSKICIEQELSLTAKEIYQKYANSESIDMLAITIEKRERL